MEIEKNKKEIEIKDKLTTELETVKAKNEQYEKEALLCKQNLPEEPEENDPNVCIIMFKYPNGEKNIEKRFLKSDKIIVLYNYSSTSVGFSTSGGGSIVFSSVVSFPSLS